jgi:hypothetical protein
MLQLGVTTEPPSVKVGERCSIPEIVCEVNEDKDKIRENIKANVKLGLTQVKPYETQMGKTISLIGGGASLNDDKVYAHLLDTYLRGIKVVTVNGAYKWCLDRDIKPSAQIVLDSREFNNRFVDPIIDKCKYLISSQCHPSMFEKLKGKEVHIWHCAGDDNFDLLKEVYGDDYFPVMGGSTVTSRAIHLLRMLGFPKLEIYGFDSCIMEHHHAYEQSENDDEAVLNIMVSGKEFKCTAAHYHQAKEFVDMISKTGEHYDLAVHGDGLISHIIKNPHSLKKKEEVE